MTANDPRQNWTAEQRRKVRHPGHGRSIKVRSAAADASFKLREYDNKPVPQWLRDIAAGKDTKPPSD